MQRRTFLKMLGASAAAGALGSFASALGANGQQVEADEDYDFLIGRVKFAAPGTGDIGGRNIWGAHPGATRNLLENFIAVVRCKVKIPTGCHDDVPIRGKEHQFNRVVDLTDIDALREVPYLFMTEEVPYQLAADKKRNLRQYLEEGGFILMDDCVSGQSDYFYQSSCDLMEEMFGSGAVVKIPNSHEVFHSVHDLSDTGLPYCQGKKHAAHGVFIDGRLAAFLSATDIHCGWANCFRLEGPEKYRKSIEMGVNIIMYAISH